MLALPLPHRRLAHVTSSLQQLGLPRTPAWQSCQHSSPQRVKALNERRPMRRSARTRLTISVRAPTPHSPPPPPPPISTPQQPPFTHSLPPMLLLFTCEDNGIDVNITPLFPAQRKSACSRVRKQVVDLAKLVQGSTQPAFQRLKLSCRLRGMKPMCTGGLCSTLRIR